MDRRGMDLTRIVLCMLPHQIVLLNVPAFFRICIRVDAVVFPRRLISLECADKLRS
jgi:hypothetical protein